MKQIIEENKLIIEYCVVISMFLFILCLLGVILVKYDKIGFNECSIKQTKIAFYSKHSNLLYNELSHKRLS